jgi:hypothetical protein
MAVEAKIQVDSWYSVTGGWECQDWDIVSGMVLENCIMLELDMVWATMDCLVRVRPPESECWDVVFAEVGLESRGHLGGQPVLGSASKGVLGNCLRYCLEPHDTQQYCPCHVQ